jgi:hypothetical protein
MIKLWNYLKQKSKTIHELIKEFPNKSYRELEKYRDADRNEEAERIITQQENEELKEDPDEVRYRINWKTQYEEEEKRTGYLQEELDRIKRGNNDLHKKVAALLDAVDPATRVQKARESGL